MAAKKENKFKKSEILRRKIYHSSIDLFRERGFENVKIADICEEVKISTGTFYYYFPSKEAIFLEYANVADELMEHVVSDLEYNSQAEKLHQLVLQKVHAYSVVGQKLSNACLGAFLKHKDDSYLDVNRFAFNQFQETIEEGIRNGEFREDVDAEALTSGLRYMIGGITLHWASSKKNFDIEKVLSEHVDMLIEAMKKK